MFHHRPVRAAPPAIVARPRRVRPFALAVRLSRLTVWCSAATLIACAPSAMAQGATAAPTARNYDIPPGPLGSVLTRFSREAGVFLVGAGSTAEGKVSPGLQGNHTVESGFAALLAGTGLDAFRQADGSFGLRPASVAAAPAPTRAAPAATLPIVVVTARRPENKNIVVRRSTGGALFSEADAREIPFAINIVGEAEIRNRQATTLSEMLATDPSVGFEYQDAGGMPLDRLSIRGFTQGNQVINGQLTGLDVISAQAENVDRVEVLRGPAAFRYGFAQAGGVINIVTKRPTSDPKTVASLLAAADRQTGAHVDHSSHFDEGKRFGYRLNAVFSDGDTPIDTQQRRRGLLAIATDFKLASDLTVYGDLQYSSIRARGGSSLFPSVGVPAAGAVPEPIDPRRTFQPAWNSFETDSLTGGLEIEYEFAPNWQLRSMFRYLKANDQGYGGVTFYEPFLSNGDHVLANYGYKNEFDSRSNVTFVQGKFVSGPVAHQLTAGVSVVDGSVDGFNAANNNTVRTPSNLYRPATLPYTDAGAFVPGFQVREKQSGAFLSNEMTAGRWRPLVGLRYSKIDYDATFNAAGSRTSKVSPMVALSYDVDDAVTAYGSYSTGLENGGLAPLGTTNANSQLPPLVTKGYEIGVKTDLLDGAATLDAALFRIEKTSAFTDSTNTYVQRGKQVHDGVEVMARGRFWKPLEVSAGITYIDAGLKDNPATDGNRPANVPRLSAVLFGEYAVVPVAGFYLSAQVTYRGAREYDIPNLYRAPAFTLLGLGVRYVTSIAERRSTLRVNVDNLTNEAYYKKLDTFDGTFGAPRTLKASLEVEF